MQSAIQERENPRAGSYRFTLFLGALTALGSLSIHMIVPALPLIAAQLQVGQAQVQLTIALYLVAIGIGQLAWGPVADRFGRRPAMLASLVLFCLGSSFVALSTSIASLLVGRVIQGIGSSGTLVTSRAMVADLAAPGKAVGGLAALATITLISPALAPGVGGLLVEVGGWRTIFVLLVGVSAALGIGAWRRFPETRIAVAAYHGPTPWRRYASLLGDRRFLGVTFGAALWTGMMYHFLAASPFVLRASYHLSPAQSGLVYLCISGFMIAGTLLVRLLGRSASDMLKFAVAVMILGIALLAGAALDILPGLAGLAAAMAVCALACGICVPCALALAQENAAGAVATASSLFGALQMLVAAMVSSTISHIFDRGPALPGSLAVLALAGCACFVAGVRNRSASRM